jgi:hypothetical protein
VTSVFFCSATPSIDAIVPYPHRHRRKRNDAVTTHIYLNIDTTHTALKMPLRAERPIVRVEHSSMRTIETRSTENLFGLWSGE